MSKGSTPRPIEISKEQYRDNWDKIFKPKPLVRNNYDSDDTRTHTSASAHTSAGENNNNTATGYLDSDSAQPGLQS